MKEYSESYKKKKAYYEKNKERINAKMKIYHIKYYEKNQDKLLKKGKYYYEKNKEKRRKQINEYQTKRKKIDPNYKLSKNLRHLLNQAINYYEKNGVILNCKRYPIDLHAIITHLLPFPNRKIYQIDHIKPLCSFDLTNNEQIKIAFAPENLQWLTFKKNMEKGKK